MQDYQQRVFAKKAALDDRLLRLTTFMNGDVFASLHPEDRDLLIARRDAMENYSVILGLRIARLSE